MKRISWKYLPQEGVILFLSLVTGVLLCVLISFPNTKIEVGYGHLVRDSTSVPPILIDFDTPTAEQLHEFKSVEEFDQWIVLFAGERLAGESVSISPGEMRLVRVPSLKASNPEKLLEYTIPWSGVRKLAQHLWPPRKMNLMIAWVPFLLPYCLTVAARLAGRFVGVARVEAVV